MGRFLSLDPLAADYLSFSDYSYVAGNPIIFIDPTGRSVEAAYENEEEQTRAKRLEKEDEEFENRVFKNQKRQIKYAYHVISETLIPEIHKNTKAALIENPSLGVLTYIGRGEANKRKNRYYATQNCSTCLYTEQPDEFPYAMTMEGGANATCNCVIAWENQIQGWMLSQMVTKNKLQRGDKIVILLSGNPELAPENVPDRIPDSPTIPNVPFIIPPPAQAPVRVPVPGLNIPIPLLPFYEYLYEYNPGVAANN